MKKERKRNSYFKSKSLLFAFIFVQANSITYNKCIYKKYCLYYIRQCKVFTFKTVILGLTFTLILAAFSPNTTKFVAIFKLTAVMQLNSTECC